MTVGEEFALFREERRRFKVTQHVNTCHRRLRSVCVGNEVRMYCPKCGVVMPRYERTWNGEYNR